MQIRLAALYLIIMSHIHGAIVDNIFASLRCFTLEKCILPISSRAILLSKKARAELTYQEQLELKNLTEVSYLPIAIPKSTREIISNEDRNRTDFPILIPRDQIQFRYEIISNISSGRYGHLVKTKDHSTNETVALKFINKMFHDHCEDEMPLLYRIRERALQNHVIPLHSKFIYRGFRVLAFPYYEENLFQVILAHAKANTVISLKNIQRLARQMVQALVYLKSYRIIHFDIKPENILVKRIDDQNLDFILTDFGFAQKMNVSAPIGGTLSYVSPDILMRELHGTASDMWSLGATLFAMVSKSNFLHLRKEDPELIMLKLLLRTKETNPGFFLSIRDSSMYNSEIRETKLVPFNKQLIYIVKPLYPGQEHTFDKLVDFLHKCFRFHAEDRITPKQAQKHPFLVDTIASH